MPLRSRSPRRTYREIRRYDLFHDSTLSAA